MARYKLLIAYEGTKYHGWQVQPNGVSIQGLIEEALQVILRKEIRLFGSGRTDAGVHALEQVAHFSVDQPLNLFKLRGSLNGLLPEDIRVLAVEEADEMFHAQYSATGKIYHYHLYLEQVLNPFRRAFVWHIPYLLDLEKMRMATEFLIGTHDFSAFANEAHRGVAAHDPFRTLKRIDMVPEEGGMRLEFEGDGFLYMMVRNIVGTLVEVANGKIAVEELAKIRDSKDRRQAGQAAPAQGLFLMKVQYPQTY